MFIYGFQLHDVMAALKTKTNTHFLPVPETHALPAQQTLTYTLEEKRGINQQSTTKTHSDVQNATGGGRELDAGLLISV